LDIIRLTYPFAEEHKAPRQVMAIGYFDGVHLGHREVIRKAIYSANLKKITSSIMTFDPHPREVLGNLHSQYITPLEEKLECFADCGIDRTYIITFNRTLSLLTPEQFIRQVLFALNVETVVVGFNFTFGHLGSGTVDLLRSVGAEQMKVSVIRPFHIDGIKVSSTVIREKLHEGDIDKVNELLGRPYAISGQVVHGLGRGRTMGIPTANIEPRDNYVIPRHGVYAVKVIVGKVKYSGILNIGMKPTFDDNPPEPTLEVHILGYNQTIYGKSIQIEFIQYIRQEQKFSSVDLLVKQIQEDILTAEKILKSL
jgi:riboflavin kinase/FMN adenylyltransferase